jgi:hypothetical protein
VGTAVATLSPTVTGSVSSYSVAPALPTGLSLNTTSGQIAGTPTVAAAAASYTITASNSSGSTSFVLGITVNIAPPSALSYPGTQTYTVGVPITALNPTVTGVVASYSVAPALPAGLSLNSINGQISGTPGGPVATMAYSITATNSTGSTNFALTITVQIAAPSGLNYPGPQTYTVGTPVVPLNPTVLGVVSTYSVTPALPVGLSLNTATGQIAGTPTVATGAGNYTITAGNSTGSTNFALGITVQIAAPSGLGYPSPQSYTVGAAIAPLSPSVTGTVSGYGVSPALPAGLVLNTINGLVSGTPTAATGAADYTITATNSTGSTVFALNIAVRIAAPSGLSYLGPQTYTVGTTISPLNPTVTGTVASYSVAPALPAGLILNVTSGQISGTPTAAIAAASYTVTASNSTGSTAFALSITVRVAAPSGLSYASPQTYFVGSAISPLTPAVTGTVSSYSVSPSLPAGLVLNTTSGQISGTPTAATAAASYTITASNSTGSTTFPWSATVNIAPPSALSYPSPQIYVIATAIQPLVPTVTGSVAGYTVSPALPAGLALNTTSGQISGTPTAATAAASYTITASNSTGGTTFALGITVTDIAAPPAAPTVTVSYGLKEVVLNWSAVSGATYYRIFKNPDGTSGYSQLGSNQAGLSYADIVSVHLTDWLNANYTVDACNTFGCTSSAAIYAMTSAQAVGYVKASDPEGQDGFGKAVAISADGSTLVVGSPGKDNNDTGINGTQAFNNLDAAGAVFVYVRSGTTWVQQAFLQASNVSVTPPGSISIAGFGWSVSLSSDGNTLAVGANRETSDATGINGNQTNTNASGAGAAYIFVRAGTNWSQQAYIKASNTGVSDFFGTSVSLSSDGNTLAVGAYQEASNATGINGNQLDNSQTGTGAVYVYVRSGASWSQQAYLKSSYNYNAGRAILFGVSVALSSDGNTLAVGAFGDQSSATGINGDQTNHNAIGSGAVYVFTRSGVDWSQEAYVKASNTTANDRFGWSVAVSADGNTLAVGAWNLNKSFIFTRSGAVWSQQAYIFPSITHLTDSYGHSVALSADGNMLAVGAHYESSNAVGIGGNQTDTSSSMAGAVYVFMRSGSSWMQKSYVKASNTDRGDEFGESVSLSGDGLTLAVGGFAEDSSAPGIGGDQTIDGANTTDSGAVYLY